MTVRRSAYSESYFAPDELGQRCERADLLDQALERLWGSEMARLFKTCWQSHDVQGPRFEDWHRIISNVSQRTKWGGRIETLHRATDMAPTAALALKPRPNSTNSAVAFGGQVGSPFSAAVRLGDLLFLSALGPIDPLTKKPPTSDLAGQVRTVLANLRETLDGCGSSMQNVLSIKCFLRSEAGYETYLSACRDVLRSPLPAMTTLIAEIPRPDVLLLLDVVAFLGA